MAKDERRASKVTLETQEESKRLSALWAAVRKKRQALKKEERLTQAVFGETFGIGNQSAVGQFLRGEVPLSLKAARGFALGLGCQVKDFSPRLAAEAATIASMISSEPLKPEVAELAAAINQLPDTQRGLVLLSIRNVVALAGTVPVAGQAAANTDVHTEIPPLVRAG